MESGDNGGELGRPHLGWTRDGIRVGLLAPREDEEWDAMRLDDRPVIEQLLNPTPLNILDEVVADMEEYLPPRARTIATDVLEVLRDEVKALSLDLSAETLVALDEALQAGVDGLNDHMGGVVWETVSEFDERLSGRLEQ